MNRRIWMALIMGMLQGSLSLADVPSASGQIGESDIGIHVMAGGWRNFPGLAVAANHVINGQWALGGSIWYMRSRLADSEGGDLDHAQYYSQYLDQRALGTEGRITYFFREEGARRWGPLVRGGLGYAYRRTTANWTRYDRDPGFFTFGNNRALDSGQGETRDTSSFYTRVGAAFQFALGKTSLTEGGGHILEIGANAVLPFGRKSASYTKTTGEVVEIQEPVLEPMLDISYRIIF